MSIYEGSPKTLQDEEKQFNDHTKLVTYREFPFCLAFPETGVNWFHLHPTKLLPLLRCNVCPFLSMYLPNALNHNPTHRYSPTPGSKLLG